YNGGLRSEVPFGPVLFFGCTHGDFATTPFCKAQEAISLLVSGCALPYSKGTVARACFFWNSCERDLEWCEHHAFSSSGCCWPWVRGPGQRSKSRRRKRPPARVPPGLTSSSPCCPLRKSSCTW